MVLYVKTIYSTVSVESMPAFCQIHFSFLIHITNIILIFYRRSLSPKENNWFIIYLKKYVRLETCVILI